jgi:hypothetical protein
MADVVINKFTTQILRDGATPSSPGFVVSEGQDPVNPPGSGQNHLPVTIDPTADGLAITDAQVLSGAGTTSQYLRGDASLATFPDLTGYVPYTGANQTVNLNTQQLQAGHTTLTTNGSTETLTINHTSGSGKAINVTKGGAGEGLYVNKTSGSGNAATIVGTLEATTLVKTGGTSSQFLKADGSVDSTTYQNTADKAQPNGYASLDSNGKVPLTQINDALLGNVNYQGLWNASTNTPTLANPPSSGTKGYYYIVSTAGTFAGISFEVGDWIISNGSAWQKVDNTDAVSSVFGRTGNVVASNGDYNTSQVTESGNLYYTDGRARNALSFAAGSGAYNTSTGVITIPTNNNQITNGAGYITGAALGAYLPLAGGTMTGQLISSFNTSGEPFVNATFSGVGGANIGGILTNGNAQAHVRFLVGSNTWDGPGAKQWQIRVGNGNSEDNFKIYSWTYGNDVMTILSDATVRLHKYTTNGFVKFGSSNGTLEVDTNVYYLASNPSGFTSNTGTVTVTGSATTNYLPKFTGSTSIGNSNLINDSNGNLGLAVTPNSWSIGARAFQIGARMSLYNDGFNNALFANNMFFDGSNNIYINTAAVGRFYIENTGAFVWNQAPIGTAGTAVPFTTPMTLFASGNLLVGSGSDSGFRLDVNGTGRFSGHINSVGTGLNSSVRINNTTASTGVDWHLYSLNNGNFGLYNNTGGAYAFQVTSSGNVGIGTSTYSVSAGYTGLGINNATNGGVLDLLLNDVKKGEFYITNSSFNMYGFAGVGINLTVNNDVSKNLSITTNGNVLIGTTTDAGYKLDVNGTGRFSGTNYLVNTSTGSGSTYQRILNTGGDLILGLNSSAGSSLAAGGLPYATSIYNNTNTAMQFGTNAVFNMTIAAGGNVGIGLNNPSSLLHISGPNNDVSGNYYSQLKINGTGTYPNNIAGLSFENSGVQQHIRFVQSGVVKFQIRYNAGNTVDNRLKYYSFITDTDFVTFNANNGNVLIGTTTDNGNKLRVNGTIFSDSSVTATSFFESSDATLKTLIEDDYQAKGIDSVVAKLYIKNGKQELGYYAQDLEGVLPSAVNKGSDGLLNLSYREVHTAKIAYLEQKIKQLENELGRLS